MEDEQKQRDLLVIGARKLSLDLTDQVVDDLLIYLEQLNHWRRRMNLVGRSMLVESIIENHFLDSLTLLAHLEGDNIHLLDVGSGAGFPGLVCKAARRKMALTIVEPRLKRVSFLRHIVRTLNFERVEIIAGRIEDEKVQESGRQLTHVTGRAVSELSQFLEMISGCLYPGVRIICMKGPKWRQELEKAGGIMEGLSLHLSGTRHLRLPFSEAERTILIVEKK